VLTAENIKSYGWRTLADALNSIRGLYVHTDRNYTFVSNRGFSRTFDYDARVLIMIDGRRMNEGISDGGAIAEEFLLDMNLIERIEYVPGTGSSVYGANALLGVVNVITKRGKDLQGVKLAGEVGSLDTSRTRATYGKQWDNGAELLLQGSQFYSHGNDRLYFPEFSHLNGGYAEDMDQERNSRAFGKFTYGGLTFQGGFADRFKRIPTASYKTAFNDPRHSASFQQGYVDMDYLTQINPDLGLELRAYHHWSDYQAYRPKIFFGLDRSEGADARWFGGEAKLIGTQFAHHKWMLGIELRNDQRFHLESNIVEPFVPVYLKTNTGWRAGLYAQDEYRITDSLLINAGIRLDHHHAATDLQLNPRIGLIWDINPAFTSKLLYGSAFRAPNLLELTGADSFNKTAQEELIKSYEAVLEWYPGGGLKLLGTLFYNDLSKVLVLALSNSQSPTLNSGNYTTLGFELGAEKLWNNGRQLKLTWTHQSTRDVTGHNDIWAEDSPKNLVKAHYAEPLFHNNLRLGFEEIFVDERLSSNKNTVPGYHLLNINLALVKPIYGIQASLGVYNVLDQNYKIVGAPDLIQDTLTMDGRTVRFRCEYGF
jgi:iron complex outermembrane receptor protein